MLQEALQDHPSEVRSRVLLVEDDPLLLEAVTALLRRHGYEVIPCNGGRHALACLERGERPAAVVLDLIMDDMNGWELRAALLARPEWARIPVVVLSGDSSPQARAIRADGQLPKPVEHERLLAMLDALTGARADVATGDVQRELRAARQHLDNVTESLHVAVQQCARLESHATKREAFSLRGVRQLVESGRARVGEARKLLATADALHAQRRGTVSIQQSRSVLH
jgi:CheY-like chemotaxis protein